MTAEFWSENRVFVLYARSKQFRTLNGSNYNKRFRREIIIFRPVVFHFAQIFVQVVLSSSYRSKLRTPLTSWVFRCVATNARRGRSVTAAACRLTRSLGNSTKNLKFHIHKNIPEWECVLVKAFLFRQTCHSS